MNPEIRGDKAQGADPGALPGDVALEQLARTLPRPDPDAAARARVLRNVQAAFEARRRLGQQRRRRVIFAGAAAMMVCTLTVVVLDAVRLNPPEPSSIAHHFSVDALRGEVQVLDHDASRTRMATIGTPFAAGQRIHSASAASVSLRSTQGMRLRLAEDSTLQLQADGALALVRGRVYLDTDGVRNDVAKQVRVSVGAAQIENLGTRFSVARQGASLTIAVRSGSVRWAQGRDRTTVQARERLHVESGRVISRAPLADPDAEFAWALAAAAFPSSGAPVADVLAWYADETGRSLRLAPGVDRLLAQRVEGVSQAAEPARRVEAVLAAAGLSLRVTEEALVVDCINRRACDG